MAGAGLTVLTPAKAVACKACAVALDQPKDRKSSWASGRGRAALGQGEEPGAPSNGPGDESFSRSLPTPPASSAAANIINKVNGEFVTVSPSQAASNRVAC